MLASVAVVRRGELARADEADRAMPAASLVKPVLAHLALLIVDDLDEPVGDAGAGTITVRHVLSHSTGLPNWRPPGEPLAAMRAPGSRWGYSGEGYVLLLGHLEARTRRPIDRLAADEVFGPLGMTATALGPPEPGYHGYRPMTTTAADYARFLGHVLAIDDDRWRPQCRIDDELAWGAGWGLELGEPRCGWQWGFDAGASNFVIGCPATGDGVVVLTDDAGGVGRDRYRAVVERELPGDHPSLRVESNPRWLELFD